MNKLVILGAGGHGAVVADVARAVWPHSDIVFLDDRFPALSRHWSWPVAGRFRDYVEHVSASTHFLVAIGQNAARLAWQSQLRAAGASIATLIHPTATVSTDAKLGVGTVVFPHAVVNIGAVLGDACIVNSAAVVEHDCVLGDAVHVCPKAALAGGVKVGNSSTIGVGAAVRHGLVIGEGVFLGAGAAAVCDIQSGITVVGVPARPIKPTRAN